MPGLALRTQRRRNGEEGDTVPGKLAAWLFAAWPSAARPVAAQSVAAFGNRHSRRVALLKRVLPAIGLALLLLIAAWPRLAALWERLAFPPIDLREARELRMIDPRYSGADRLGRPFVVTAAVGRQVPDRQDLVSLETPRADMKTHGGVDIVVTAATGIYQSQAQLLDLFGQVTLVHQNGTRFATDTARVDVANNTAEGSDPVAGDGPSGDIKAEGFRLLDKGDTIVFTGKSDMHLHGAKPGGGNGAPAALPAPIALTAARVEAAARPALAMATRPAAIRLARAQTGPRHPADQALRAKLAAGKSAAATPAARKPASGKPTAAKPGDRKPVDRKPVDRKPVDRKTA
jgi:lipopolysaccharide export system protein LptC